MQPSLQVVTVNGSPMLRLDVTASNGALHLLERVLFPPTGKIADLIANEKDLTTFAKALAAVNMTEYLRSGETGSGEWSSGMRWWNKISEKQIGC